MPADERGTGDVLDAFHQADQPVVLVGLRGREPDTAVAHDDGGDAVPARRREQRVPGDLAVEVRVHVDEAGRDEQAVGVDLLAALPSTAPTSVTTPSVIATSAVRAGAPVPSTTVPPLITRSCMVDSHLVSQGSKERADVGDQQIGFLERGEVSATIESGVALQVEAVSAYARGMRNISFGNTAAAVGTFTNSPIGPKRSLRCDSQ